MLLRAGGLSCPVINKQICDEVQLYERGKSPSQTPASYEGRQFRRHFSAFRQSPETLFTDFLGATCRARQRGPNLPFLAGESATMLSIHLAFPLLYVQKPALKALVLVLLPKS